MDPGDKHRDDIRWFFQESLLSTRLQDGDQHDDGPDIDATAEEAQRRRRLSAPAAVPAAAEAEPPVVLGAELQRSPARLAVEVRHVEPVAAAGAALALSLAGEIAVTSEQEVVESDIGKHFGIQGWRPPASGPTPMAKPGRNDRCPCGSGKKYKACCLTKDEATERERLTAAQAARDERTAEKRQSLREVREARVAKLSGAAPIDGHLFDDDLTAASNAVLDLIRDGRLDEAEAAARDLLVRYPEVPDGWDRLGMVHEKRGENRQAADCYRKLIAFVREHPDDFDAGIIDDYTTRIDRLDPPAAD